MSNCDVVAGGSLIDFGRVKAGASRPRAARGYGLAPGQIDPRVAYRAVGTFLILLLRLVAVTFNVLGIPLV